MANNYRLKIDALDVSPKNKHPEKPAVTILTFWYADKRPVLAPLDRRYTGSIGRSVRHRALDSRQRYPKIFIDVNVGRVDVSMNEPILVQALNCFQKLVYQKAFLKRGIEVSRVESQHVLQRRQSCGSSCTVW